MTFYLTNKQAKEFLQVRAATTWKSHLFAIGLEGDTPNLTENQLKALLCLKLYLTTGIGRNSKNEFRRIYLSEGLEKVIDLIRKEGLDCRHLLKQFIEAAKTYQEQCLLQESTNIQSYQSEDVFNGF